jgi:hypothetical protein
MRQFMHKTLPLALVGAACLSLATIGEAKAFNFVENSPPPDAGGTPLTAANTTVNGPVGTASTIEGRLGATGVTVDMFKILIDSAGQFTAATIDDFDPNSVTLAPDELTNPFFYLFNADGDVPAIASGTTINQILNAGNYFLAITKAGITPNSASQTGGTLVGWSNSIGVTTPRNVAYKIAMTHTPTAVPTPALLPGLVGMGLSLWRKKQKDGTMAEV